jgi:hypothetical protein
VRSGFSPLDDELGLLPGELSATLAEGLARLGAWMPFARAAEQLAFFWGVRLDPATVRRHTQAAGAAYEAVQTTEVERLEREAPEPPPGPARQQVSADGAMVPLVGGRWAEVRTVGIGTLAAPAGSGARDGEVHATELSYFSRMTDHESFIRLAHVELHRRGTERAGRVVGVMDGAEWEQKLLDRYRPDAVRILDFPHAVEHLASAAQATFGVGSATAEAWLEAWAHALKRGPAAHVLAALRALPISAASDPRGAAAARDTTLGYLEKRRVQIRYAEFLALGYPIGSGLIESANKLVVEARLKGSGMHWAPPHVNPMLALRTIACADRWAEAWPQICDQLRASALARRQARARQRRASHPTALPEPPPPRSARSAPHPSSAAPPRPKLIVDGRPTAAHPWKRPSLNHGRARLTC